jgi:hypothetical protein
MALARARDAVPRLVWRQRVLSGSLYCWGLRSKAWYQANDAKRADFEPGAGTRPARGFRPARTSTEAKAGFKTTEFVIMLAIVAAILIATYVADADLGANEGWRYIAWWQPRTS